MDAREMDPSLSLAIGIGTTNGKESCNKDEHTLWIVKAVLRSLMASESVFESLNVSSLISENADDLFSLKTTPLHTDFTQQ